MMQQQDTFEFQQKQLGFKGDQLSTHIQTHILGLLNGPNDSGPPPPGYDRAFIMYTVNSDMVPSFYNGTSSIGGGNKVTIEVKSITDSKIKVAAVVCRPGFADSEVVIKHFEKGEGLAPENDMYIVRGQILDKANLTKKEVNTVWVMRSDISNTGPLPSSDSSQMLPPPSSESSDGYRPPP